MSIDFESKHTYGDDDKYIKAKVRINEKKITTNFHNKKVPKEKIPCKCLSIIMLDSVIKAYNKYYLQMFLEEYIQEKIKFENYINDSLNSDSDDDNDDCEE